MPIRTVETVEELKRLVGQELGVGDWLEITQERVNTFAAATGDHQWIHVDTERAAKSPFGATIAHGYLTLALLPSLRVGWDGAQLELHQTMSVNYGLNRVRFPAPVRVGKRIRLRSKLLDLAEVAPNTYQLTYQQTVEIEAEAKPAMVAETISRLYL